MCTDNDKIKRKWKIMLSRNFAESANNSAILYECHCQWWTRWLFLEYEFSLVWHDVFGIIHYTTFVKRMCEGYGSVCSLVPKHFEKGPGTHCLRIYCMLRYLKNLRISDTIVYFSAHKSAYLSVFSSGYLYLPFEPRLKVMTILKTLTNLGS